MKKMKYLSLFFLLVIGSACSTQEKTQDEQLFVFEDAVSIHYYPKLINDAGDVVGAIKANNGAGTAFFWSKKYGIRFMDRPSWLNGTWLNAMNNKGVVVGYFNDEHEAWGAGSLINRPFIWSNLEGFQRIEVPPEMKDLHCRATDINDKGQVVGWVNDHPSTMLVPSKAFFWSKEDGFIKIEHPGTLGSSMHLIIKNNGKVLGRFHRGYNDTEKPAAATFLWEKGLGLKLLDVIGEEVGLVEDMNEDGVVVGRMYMPEKEESPRQFLGKEVLTQPFVWSEEKGMSLLEGMDGFFIESIFINNLGKIVGVVKPIERRPYWETRAVEWSESGKISFIKLPKGVPYSSIEDLNDKNQAVGTLHFDPDPKLKERIPSVSKGVIWSL